MDKSIKNIYIPKLRFKGFDNNEIIFKNLDEIFLIKNGYTPSKRNKLFWENGNIPWFRIDDIRINGQILEDSLIKTTNIAINKKNLFKKNSIILSTTATVGIHALIKTDFLCNQQLTSFQIKDEFNISHLFSFYHFYKISNWCKKNIRSTSFPCIEIKDLKKQLFWIPTIEEQNKIAKFFSLIDQQISLLENKLQLIEQIRLFLNNSLYKNSYKNGDEYFLKELLENPRKEPIKNVDECTPIKIMLNGKGFIKSNLDVKITNKGRKYYERSSGELIIGLQNFHNKSIAILDDQFFKPIMSSAIASFISKTDNDLFIIKEMLLNKNHQNYILNNASGTGQKEYTVNKILQTKIKLPSKEIQQNYKNKFIKIDLLIELINKKIKILNYKKLFYLKNIFI